MAFSMYHRSFMMYHQYFCMYHWSFSMYHRSFCKDDDLLCSPVLLYVRITGLLYRSPAFHNVSLVFFMYRWSFGIYHRSVITYHWSFSMYHRYFIYVTPVFFSMNHRSYNVFLIYHRSFSTITGISVCNTRLFLCITVW